MYKMKLTSPFLESRSTIVFIKEAINLLSICPRGEIAIERFSSMPSEEEMILTGSETQLELIKLILKEKLSFDTKISSNKIELKSTSPREAIEVIERTIYLLSICTPGKMKMGKVQYTLSGQTMIIIGSMIQIQLLDSMLENKIPFTAEIFIDDEWYEIKSYLASKVVEPYGSESLSERIHWRF